MKKYTSPAVIGCASSALYSVIAAVNPAMSAAMVGGSGSPSDMLVSAVKYVASKLFGEDFSSLKPDALMPCLES